MYFSWRDPRGNGGGRRFSTSAENGGNRSKINRRIRAAWTPHRERVALRHSGREAANRGVPSLSPEAVAKLHEPSRKFPLLPSTRDAVLTQKTLCRHTGTPIVQYTTPAAPPGRFENRAKTEFASEFGQKQEVATRVLPRRRDVFRVICMSRWGPDDARRAVGIACSSCSTTSICFARAVSFVDLELRRR